MSGTPQITSSVLCWPKRLLSADDLRRHLTSQRELVLLPKTVVTPLAHDELKAKGVRVSWQVPGTVNVESVKTGTWIYAEEKPEALVASVIAALEREGIKLPTMAGSAQALAEAVVRGTYAGGILFAADAALACCIANKIAGIRAAAVLSVLQVTRAKKTLGANVFVVDVPGRTFFELRQMLRAIVVDGGRCPDEVGRILKELDGHAHR
jgi:ribose 5-phosphate isomerase RpiB